MTFNPVAASGACQDLLTADSCIAECARCSAIRRPHKRVRPWRMFMLPEAMGGPAFEARQRSPRSRLVAAMQRGDRTIGRSYITIARSSTRVTSPNVDRMLIGCWSRTGGSANLDVKWGFFRSVLSCWRSISRFIRCVLKVQTIVFMGS